MTAKASRDATGHSLWVATLRRIRFAKLATTGRCARFATWVTFGRRATSAPSEALLQGLRTTFRLVLPSVAVVWAYLGSRIGGWLVDLRTRVRETALF